TADRLATTCNAVPGTPGAELCGNTVDDDCDGVTDEGYDNGATCSAGVGACVRSGTKVCTADRLATTCNAVPGTPGTELCGNTLDDDCDGSTDEGYDNGAACSAGTGVCRRTGNKVCSADRLSTTCNAVPGMPGAELCGNN